MYRMSKDRTLAIGKSLVLNIPWATAHLLKKTYAHTERLTVSVRLRTRVHRHEDGPRVL